MPAQNIRREFRNWCRRNSFAERSPGVYLGNNEARMFQRAGGIIVEVRACRHPYEESRGLGFHYPAGVRPLQVEEASKFLAGTWAAPTLSESDRKSYERAMG